MGKPDGFPAALIIQSPDKHSVFGWVIDQYQVSTDKRSGITSHPNGYSDDERYSVHLVEKVVRVSVDTAGIVKGLQGLAFRG